MSNPSTYETFGRSTARDTAKRTLSRKCPWTATMQIKKSTKEQRLTSLIIESFILDQSLKALEDISEECKIAYAAGYLHETERIMSSKGYDLYEYHNRLEQHISKWCESAREAEICENHLQAMMLAIGKSLDPGATAIDVIGISSMFVRKCEITMQAIRSLGNL